VPRKQRLIELDDLFRINVVHEAEISPDGQQVVLAIGRPDQAKNKNFAHLFLVSADGGPLRQLTFGDHVDRLPRWTPDGRAIVFTSTREKACCLYVLSMEGGEPVRLTDRDGDVADFSISPDGQRVAYAYRPKSDRQKLERDDKRDEIARGPEFVHIHRLFHKLDGVGFWNGHHQQIYTVGIGGGRPTQLTHEGYDHLMPRYAPDGASVAFRCNRRANPDLDIDNMDIFVVPAQGGRARQVTQKYGPMTGFAWSPDGKSIAYLGHHGGRGQSNLHNLHVWVIPAKGGTPRNLTPHVDNHCFNLTLSDVSEIKFDGAAPVWSHDGTRLYFTVSDRGACHLYETDVERGRRKAAADGEAPYPGVRRRVAGDVCVAAVSRAAHSNRVALVVTSATDPTNVYTLDLDDAPARSQPITDVNGSLLSKVRCSTPEPFRSRRGRTVIEGWVLKPPGFKAGRKYPLILQIHGGPHTQYGYTFMHEMQWHAARGYVVLFTNPRGSVGYGLDHLKALHARWGVPDYTDLMACVDDLLKQGYIDAKRMFVTGGSYGGFMTNGIIGKTHRFRAAVTDRSVVNLTSMMASDYGHDLSFDFGGMPWEAPAAYRKLSPLTAATNIKTPLLIVHSEQDLRCPIGQAEELFLTLKYLGREVEFVRFMGESHGLSRCGRPQNRAERLRRILAWFDAHGGADKEVQPPRAQGDRDASRKRR